MATSAAQQNNYSNKGLYDPQARDQELHTKNRVLTRNLHISGTHKTAERWKAEPHTVKEKMPGLPLYQLKL